MSEGMDDVRARLIKLVRQVVAPATIPDPFPTERQLSELGVSSLRMVNLMLAVEVEFDVTIPQEEITPENFHSVDAMRVMVIKTLPG